MKRASILGALAIVAGSFLFAAPAAHAGFGSKSETQGGVLCRTWKQGSNTYPYDDEHLWVCMAAPSGPRVSQIGGTVQQFPPVIKNFLQAQGNYYYYFINRADMINFMAAKFADPGYQGTASRCGNTWYNPAPLQGKIVSSILDFCRYGSTNVQNADLAKTTAHESGHGYDLAKFRANGDTGVPPSRSAAFKTLANTNDRLVLTPGAWNGWNDTQKTAYLCKLFSTFSPSPLEIDLGATNNKVCTNTTTLNPFYAPAGIILDPLTIAEQYRIPYFLTNVSGSGVLWAELWAEEFARLALDGGPLLSMTDQIIKATLIPTGPKNAFSCSRWAMQQFWDTNAPPPLSGPKSLGTQIGCTNNPGSWTTP